MLLKSHVDKDKIDKVPTGQPFVYKDVVDEDFPDEEHTSDGKRFKAEVENGVYEGVEVVKDNDKNRVLYKKL